LKGSAKKPPLRQAATTLGASGRQRGGKKRETRMLEASNLTTARQGKTCEAVRAGKNNRLIYVSFKFFK